MKILFKLKAILQEEKAYSQLLLSTKEEIVLTHKILNQTKTQLQMLQLYHKIKSLMKILMQKKVKELQHNNQNFGNSIKSFGRKFKLQ